MNIDELKDAFIKAEIDKGIAITNAIHALNKANAIMQNNFNLSDEENN